MVLLELVIIPIWVEIKMCIITFTVKLYLKTKLHSNLAGHQKKNQIDLKQIEDEKYDRRSNP